MEAEAERILGLIADPDRLRVFGALALGATSSADVARVTGIEERVVEKSLARLIAGDLVAREEDGGLRLLTEEILVVARRAAAERRSVEGEGGSADVLGRFMKGGRITSFPAQRSKRLVVLDHVAQSFEPGRYYSEAEVNRVLSEFHDDVAALRRYLVDEELMERDRGRYWRAGGSVDV